VVRVNQIVPEKPRATESHPALSHKAPLVEFGLQTVLITHFALLQ